MEFNDKASFFSFIYKKKKKRKINTTVVSCQTFWYEKRRINVACHLHSNNQNKEKFQM